MQDRRVDMSSALTRAGATSQFAVILVDEPASASSWDRDERLALQPHEIPEDAIDGARLLHVDDVDQAAAIAAPARPRRRYSGDQRHRSAHRAHAGARRRVTIPIFAEHVPSALTGRADPGRRCALRREHDGLLVVTRWGPTVRSPR